MLEPFRVYQFIVPFWSRHQREGYHRREPLKSHIGISLNEAADDLAKESTQKPFVDNESNMSLSRIKKGIRQRRNILESENAIRILEGSVICKLKHSYNI